MVKVNELEKTFLGALSFVNLGLYIVLILIPLITNIGALVLLFFVQFFFSLYLVFRCYKKGWEPGVVFNALMFLLTIIMFWAISNNWEQWIVRNVLSTSFSSNISTIYLLFAIIIIPFFVAVFSLILLIRGSIKKGKKYSYTVWVPLVVFGGVLGGILAYIILRKKEPKKASALLVVGIISGILLWGSLRLLV